MKRPAYPLLFLLLRVRCHMLLVAQHYFTMDTLHCDVFSLLKLFLCLSLQRKQCYSHPANFLQWIWLHAIIWLLPSIVGRADVFDINVQTVCMCVYLTGANRAHICLTSSLYDHFSVEHCVPDSGPVQILLTIMIAQWSDYHQHSGGRLGKTHVFFPSRRECPPLTKSPS